MNRITFITDEQGENRFHPQDYPLVVGGPRAAINIPGEDTILAYIGLEQGHPFVQPVAGQARIWHNDELLNGSVWLKSGDQIQIGNHLILWRVQGERIMVSVTKDDNAAPILTRLHPPPDPPPAYEPSVLPPPKTAGGAHHRLGWLVVGAFVLLVLAATYVVLSSAVTIEIDPQPSDMALQGFPPAVMLRDRALALPGTYTLVASKVGYMSLREEIAVRLGHSQTRRFTLNKAPGRLTLSSKPVTADLFIDGAAIGATPVENIELSPGVHRIRLEAPHYLPLEQEIEIIGLGQVQSLSLDLKPDFAPVSLSSAPQGAQIFAAGMILGATPLTVDLDSGDHQLELRKPGYESQTVSLKITPGNPQTVPLITLNRLPGSLSLSSAPTGAIVTLDGDYQGRTPLELRVEPDENHLIRLSLSGFQTQERSISLNSGQQKSLEIQLKPEYGIVFLSVQPADAKVLIDGKPYSSAIARLRLPSRPHKLEIRKSGYLTHTNTFTPKPGISQNIEVILKPTAPTALSAGGKPTVPVTSEGQRLIRIDSGSSFMLGASRREPGRRANETVRQVLLTRPFFIGAKEVTNAEFRKYKPTHDSGRYRGVSLNTPQQPVVNVSWEDTARYLNWLSDRDKLQPAYQERKGKMELIRPLTTGYRLPSEAEWAFVARVAGRPDQAQYPWGERSYPPSHVQGNYADAAGQALLPVVIENYNDGHPVSAPVASFDPNPVGFYDLDGNVAEWCLDYYSIYPATSNKPLTDPVGPSTGRHHSIRGSSWRDASLSALRLSYRDYGEKPRNDLGFRIARYVQ